MHSAGLVVGLAYRRVLVRAFHIWISTGRGGMGDREFMGVSGAKILCTNQRTRASGGAGGGVGGGGGDGKAFL